MIEQLNMALFYMINQYAGLNPFVDTFAILTAQYMPIIFIMALICLWIKKGTTTKNIVLYAIYAAILGLIINYVIGQFYFHPRPFMIPIGTILFHYTAETSFPSDHTTFMISIALMISYFKETRKISIILLILGLIGGFSRVFAGVHFPLDIIGSIGVSIIASLAIYYLKDNLTSLNRKIEGMYSKIAER
ncbi:undecaprenyl-diphosphatase [Methanobacterium sp. MBAC-LM]|uniref:undecaprenyl-diphosphatase n=1 Tax=Methanobacterium sp. MBAC-LM TaxID=3412034 RepID=UPI003C78E9BF